MFISEIYFLFRLYLCHTNTHYSSIENEMNITNTQYCLVQLICKYLSSKIIVYLFFILFNWAIVIVYQSNNWQIN